MKHNLLLFLLMSFFPFYSWGQASSEPIGTLLTDESELVDGGLYVMAGRMGHQFYGSHYQQMGAFFFYSSFLEGKNKEHSSFREVLPYCDLLRFEKQEGEWRIRNLTAEHTDESRRFLCYDSEFPQLLKANYLINKGNRVTFAKENGVLNVSIGGKVLGYDRENMCYVLDENAAKYARVEFYHIENTRLLLSDTLQLYCIDATAYVRLKRHFKSDCFNTLMLPFDVPDYKKVFGQGAVRLFKNTGMYKFASAVMYVMKEVFGLPDQYLLMEPNSRIGKMLVSEMLQSGNFGFYDVRYTFAGKSVYSQYFIEIYRNLHFAFDFPSETIWGRPISRWWHMIYKAYLRRKLR